MVIKKKIMIKIKDNSNWNFNKLKFGKGNFAVCIFTYKKGKKIIQKFCNCKNHKKCKGFKKDWLKESTNGELHL